MSDAKWMRPFDLETIGRGADGRWWLCEPDDHDIIGLDTEPLRIFRAYYYARREAQEMLDSIMGKNLTDEARSLLRDFVQGQALGQTANAERLARYYAPAVPRELLLLGREEWAGRPELTVAEEGWAPTLTAGGQHASYPEQEEMLKTHSGVLFESITRPRRRSDFNPIRSRVRTSVLVIRAPRGQLTVYGARPHEKASRSQRQKASHVLDFSTIESTLDCYWPQDTAQGRERYPHVLVA